MRPDTLNSNRRQELPDLPGVTLVAVTSVALDPTVRALKASAGQARFARILLLSDRRPEVKLDGIEWRAIDRLGSRDDYSRFMLHRLADHIDTGHALCVQWDGFVIDGGAWRPEFLDHDYIGAIWPQYSDGHNVGNGGFSLRSARLLRACQNLPSNWSGPEDVMIGRVHRRKLEDDGLSFAPEAVARAFSYERAPRSGGEFGFHGAFHLARHVSRKDLHAIFEQLEPSILTRGEQREILRKAILRGDPRLARIMLNRLRALTPPG